MTTLLIAAFAASSGLGMLLVVAGLTGRPLLDGVGSGVQRIVGGSGLLRIASFAAAFLVVAAITGWVVGGLLAVLAVLALPGVLGGSSTGNEPSPAPRPSRRGPR